MKLTEIDIENAQFLLSQKNINEPSNDQIATEFVRYHRNGLLQITDWWVLPDRTPTQAQLDYRQALRDLPANASPSLDENGNLTGVNWPTKPE